MNFYQSSLVKKQAQEKSLAVLIDPDKLQEQELHNLVALLNRFPPDIILVGGSLFFENNLEKTILFLKKHTSLKVYLFPSSFAYLSPNVDGLLFLSLISGRNPDFLIGNQVLAAPLLHKTNLDILPTGYMLIDCGNMTTATYISNTMPIPYLKNDIALATALAGEMLGLKMIYMDGGSGAAKAISPKMIESVAKNIKIPLMVGGGIRNVQDLTNAYQSGADWAVVGTIIEENPNILPQLLEVRQNWKS